MSPLEGLSLLVGACWSELAVWELRVCVSVSVRKSRIGLLCRTRRWIWGLSAGMTLCTWSPRRNNNNQKKQQHQLLGLNLSHRCLSARAEAGKKGRIRNRTLFLDIMRTPHTHAWVIALIKTIVALQQAVRCKLFKERMAKLERGEEKKWNAKSSGAFSPRWCFRQTVNHTEGAITCSPSP